MAGTSLEGVPHSFEFTQTGEEHVCVVRVTMPDDSVQSFDATCATKHAARLIAVFKASLAVRGAKEELDNASQGQEAPVLKDGCEFSRDSSPRTLGVDSDDSEQHNGTPDMIVDIPLAEYSSSAEEDDDEQRVGRHKTRHAPIAFVPAPKTSLKEHVDKKGDDDLRKFGEKPSVGRSSLGEAQSQHTDRVLDKAPLQERFRESSDVDEGEIEPVSKRVNQKVNCPRFTPQKRKDPTRIEHISGSEALSVPCQVTANWHRSKKRSHSEYISSSKSQHTQKDRVKKQGSLKTAASNYSGPVGANESKACQLDHQQPQQQKRELHNAELPLTNGPYNHNSRIPRVPKKKSNATEAELDMTQPKNCEHSSAQQHQAPPPVCTPHPLHPGHIHSTPPTLGGHIFPAANPHPMSYAPQYAAPHMPHHPPHMGMGTSYAPPVGPYGTHQAYLPQPGFPPSIMAHTIGAYSYQQPTPNGTAAFYHTHAQASYPGPQVRETQSAQTEAEVRATVAEVAAQMAAAAAAKDAARNAKSDFEAAKRALQGKDLCAQESGKNVSKSEKSPAPKTDQRAEKEGEGGSVTVAEASAQRRTFGENDVRVISIPADDGDQEDYVSTLNEMAQKGQKCRNLSTPTFVAVRGENGSRGQQCTMSVRFVLDPEKEGILITKTVLAGRKKTSKQLAAKEILEEMKKQLELYVQSSDEEVGSKEKTSKTTSQKKNTGITTAVAALHRLYTLSALCGPPVFKPEEPAQGGNRGLWRSVVILDVKSFGKHQYEEYGSSKKNAKQRCAFKAFEALKEMKVPGVESLTNISKDGKDPEKNKAPEEEDAAPIDAIVEKSEDENGSDSSLDAELVEPDNRLLLPKDYKLVFPQTEFESEQWFKENSKLGAHFGLFVDSPNAKNVFTSAANARFPERATDVRPFQPRFLCLSTARGGMVICFPESLSGNISDSNAESHASLPEAVVKILEDPRTKKHGFAVEDGLSVLENEEDFRAEAVDDIAIISLAITGSETARRTGPLPSLFELTRHWLRKEAGKITVKGSWNYMSDIPTNLPEQGQKDIITGVLASYACFCISQQMTQAARQKRTRAHGVAVAFLQLSEKVMSTAPA